MKHFFNYLLLLALAVILVACGNESDTTSSETSGNTSNEGSDSSSGGEDYENITITFSHNQPVGSPEDVGAEEFKRFVEETSGGNITVDVYPASQLGGLREQVESTQIGEINVTMQPASVVTPFVDDIKIVDLSYILPTETEKMYQVLDSEIGTKILGTLEQGGFKGLGYWPGGYKLVTTKNKEINSPEDIKGLTIRTMESPLLIAQYGAWGANAIPIAYAEVYNALQQGIVDGQENPFQTVYLNNYHEVQGYVNDLKHGAMTYILMANKSWFDGLNADTQQLIIEAEKAGKQAAREALAETEGEYKAKIEESGTVYNDLTDEEMQSFIDISEPLHEELYGANDNQKELLKEFKEYINSIK